ncbi:MAG: hypothetical protein AB1515_04375 [Nitrospirota bacterium]
MEKTVVTILSLNYSGSHYLSLLLGSHSKTAHIGEVHHLRKAPAPGQKGVCIRCKDNSRCPILHGIGPENIGQIYETIFSRVAPDVACLIDASKTTAWAKRFVHQSTFRMKYIHLITDPRALIRRWSLTYRTRKQRFHIRWKLARTQPWLSPTALFRRLHDVYTKNWLVRNQQITQFIRDYRLDARVVTYHDIARETAGELKRLLDWIGLTYEPSQLQYWNVDHHGSQKIDYEWIKKAQRPYFDLRWQTDLPKATIDRVARDRAVLAYLSELGLSLNNDGPTRLHSLPV